MSAFSKGQRHFFGDLRFIAGIPSGIHAIGGNNDKGKENQCYDGICRSSTYRNDFLFNVQGERTGVNSRFDHRLGRRSKRRSGTECDGHAFERDHRFQTHGNRRRRGHIPFRQRTAKQLSTCGFRNWVCPVDSDADGAHYRASYAKGAA